MSTDTRSDTIQTQEELYAAMRLVRQRIRQREQNLEERWNRLPVETVKATIGSVVPVFLNNRVASGTWTVLKELFGLFRKDTGNDLKSSLLRNAKQLGFFAILRFLLRPRKEK